MNKKLLSLLLLLSFVSTYSPVYAGDESRLDESESKLSKALPYVVGAVLVGGVVSTWISYLKREEISQKIYLLERISEHLNTKTFDSKALSSEKVIELARRSGQVELLQKIIENKETEDSLRKKLLLANIFFYGGIMASSAAVTTGIIFAVIKKQEQKKQEEKQKRRAKKQKRREEERKKQERLRKKQEKQERLQREVKHDSSDRQVNESAARARQAPAKVREIVEEFEGIKARHRESHSPAEKFGLDDAADDNSLFEFECGALESLSAMATPRMRTKIREYLRRLKKNKEMYDVQQSLSECVHASYESEQHYKESLQECLGQVYEGCDVKTLDIDTRAYLAAADPEVPKGGFCRASLAEDFARYCYLRRYLVDKYGTRLFLPGVSPIFLLNRKRLFNLSDNGNELKELEQLVAFGKRIEDIEQGRTRSRARRRSRTKRNKNS